ncbi:MAG: hypothetical protein HYX51_04130 [Chloroflexi bacterium]|nr:hypothetical protein [Chloroflexota bacterium]
MTLRRRDAGTPIPDWLLDAGAAAFAVALILFAATVFNRVPYPGAHRYVRGTTPVITSPFSTFNVFLPEFLPVLDDADDADTVAIPDDVPEALAEVVEE